MPELGYLRERYGLLYHFTAALFKEAWEDGNNSECHISAAELRQRMTKVIQHLKDQNDMQKYIYKNDPVKHLGPVKIPGMISSDTCTEDKEEYY